MVKSVPHGDKKPTDHDRPGKPEREIAARTGESGKITVVRESGSFIDADDLPALIRDVYAKLGNIGEHPPELEAEFERGSYALPGFLIRKASSPEEEEEITRIYQRIDRELAVEEARADRRLQLRASR